NSTFKPTMTVEEGKATISIVLSENYHHSAGGVHGSVYFKMLDDAAFFAANSLETDVFVLTTSFTTYITRPVASGVMLFNIVLLCSQAYLLRISKADRLNSAN
ncbi:MAG: PaaI family thioesterase, partial [Alteromonas sp.]